MPRRILLLNILATIWCCTVLIARFHVAGHFGYVFLLWNLFLAAIPLGLSLGLEHVRRITHAVPLLSMWLLFFPNAPYVLTDLIHLNANRHGRVPQWLDLLLLLSFAFVALWFGFQSLHLVQRWFTRRFSRATAWVVTVTCLGLGGFGVYLGRFLRWNSWDIVHRPHLLLKDIASRILDPLHHSHTWSFTLGFGTLLLFSYLFWISTATPAFERRNVD
ncbi:MAG: DUF1361 domain-containing protein [Prosthecobacter sp.]